MKQFFIVQLYMLIWLSLIMLQSTSEQLDCLSCPDSASDAIKVINLYSAITSVCNEIFLKDLCLTDITSPGNIIRSNIFLKLFKILNYI